MVRNLNSKEMRLSNRCDCFVPRNDRLAAGCENVFSNKKASRSETSEERVEQRMRSFLRQDDNFIKTVCEKACLFHLSLQEM